MRGHPKFLIKQRFLLTPFLLLGFCLNPASGQVSVLVDSAVLYNPTGISLHAGQRAIIKAEGIVNLADENGPYETGPSGTIFVAPPVGTVAYPFFEFSAAPIGVPPLKYHKKFLIPPEAGPLMNAPYGALVAGISPSDRPESEEDFPNGFVYIGGDGTMSATSAGYLYLSVNDNYPPLDNRGSYAALITLSTGK